MRSTRLLGLVASVVLVIAGCDDGESAAPSESSTAPPDTASTISSASTVDSTTPSAPATTRPPVTMLPTTTPVVTALPGATNDVTRPSVPDGSGGVETGPLSSADVDIETEEGSVQIGDADVPESAAGLPLPDGLDLELASETGTDAGFSGTAPGTVVEIADFFRTSLPTAGYEITDERRPAGDENPTVVLFMFESAEQVGDVAVTNAPGGGTSVIVTIADR